MGVVREERSPLFYSIRLGEEGKKRGSAAAATIKNGETFPSLCQLTTLTGGIGILLTGTVVDNWYLWGMEHGLVPPYPEYYPGMGDPAGAP